VGRDIPELLAAVEPHHEQGYRAIRLQTAIPGLPASYGMPSEGKE
jgi:mannonate dehydratase